VSIVTVASKLPCFVPEDFLAHHTWLLSGVLAAGIGIGCRTNETPESQVNDVAITAQVKSKLASDTSGVVTLAAGVPKVVRVDNNFQVAPPQTGS